MEIVNDRNNYFSRKLSYYMCMLSIFVVFTHALNIKIYNLLDSNSGWGTIIYWFESYLGIVFTIAVPAFFIISSFLIFKNFNTIEKNGKYKKRILSLLIPFCIWNTIGYLFFTTINTIPYLSKSINGEGAKFSLYNYVDALINSTYSVLWFVRVLIIMAIISPLLFLIIKNKKTGLILLILLILINLFYPINEFSLVYSSIFYVVGGWIGIHYKEIFMAKSNKKNQIIWLVTFIAISIISLITGIIDIQSVRPIVLLVFTLSSWFVFDFIDDFKEPRDWMKMTFFIYCSHHIILESIEKIWLIVFKNTVAGAITDFIFAPIITIIIIVVMGKFLKKHCGKVWVIITGGRG